MGAKIRDGPNKLVGVRAEPSRAYMVLVEG